MGDVAFTAFVIEKMHTDKMEELNVTWPINLRLLKMRNGIFSSCFCIRKMHSSFRNLNIVSVTNKLHIVLFGSLRCVASRRCLFLFTPWKTRSVNLTRIILLTRVKDIFIIRAPTLWSYRISLAAQGFLHVIFCVSVRLKSCVSKFFVIFHDLTRLI